MKQLLIDIEKWDLATSCCEVPESQLLGLINNCLAQTDSACVVTALRLVDGPDRNWEIASLDIHDVSHEDIGSRLACVGHLINRMTDGYRVAWPSTLLH